MGKLFGTDGVRGVANREITPELTAALGRAAGSVLAGGNKGYFLVGRDTRHTGRMLELSLASGLASAGLNVHLGGVMTTPCLAHILAQGEYAGGAMVSASHNPAEYNGIKFMDGQGFKLDEDTEMEIEASYGSGSASRAAPWDVGRISEAGGLLESYVSSLVSQGPRAVSDIGIVLDLAHGAAAHTAPSVFERLGFSPQFVGDRPDGSNINLECGCTHPELLQSRVLEAGADVGFAYDGDADRVLAVDETGSLVDGDHILALMALDMAQRDLLPGGVVVATVMSNGGLDLCLSKAGIQVRRVGVGDRLVHAEMARLGSALGGEQSGHIIFSEKATTGDGLLTSLMILEVMLREGKPFSRLRKVMEQLPQVMKNATVASREGWEAHPDIRQAVDRGEKALGPAGRILVRASGTEPVIRIMVEGPDPEVLETVSRDLQAEVSRALGGGEADR